MIARQVGSESSQSFIDIGSGVGKLCILLSFLTKMKIFGIEQRKSLHDVAQCIVKTNKIERVELNCGNMMDINWEKFDIFFLFNPFHEHKLSSNVFAIDQDINLDPELYKRYARFVEKRIQSLPAGKHLVTLEGFGGKVPKSWRLISSEPFDDDRLNHWRKVY